MKHPHQTPSYPAKITTDNVYPPRHAPYSRKSTNAGASCGKELIQITQPRVSCNEPVMCKDQVASTSSNSPVEMQVLSIIVLNNQVTTGCSVADRSIGYQRPASLIVAGKDLVYPAKENSQQFVNILIEKDKIVTSNEVSCDDSQFQAAYESVKNLSPENAISKGSVIEETVTVNSNQQGNPSNVEMTTLYPHSILSHHLQKSKDAGENATHAKRILVNSKKEGKEGKGFCKNAKQPAKRPRKGKYINAELVYFDLETGGLYTGVDILQIAAVSNERSFMQYVTPTKPVHPRAQDVNGLKNENGTLMKRTSAKPLTWEPLETLPVGKSLQSFLEWLEAIGPCLLVAHNAPFDKEHFLYHVCKSGLHNEFQKTVLGFVNTLPFFRKKLPEFKTRRLGYRQEDLVKHLLQERYDAHDALEDVKFLQKLVNKVNAPKPDLLKHRLPF